MTTNAKLEDMFEKDPSLLRDGRVIRLEVSDDRDDVIMVSEEMLKERLRLRGAKKRSAEDEEAPRQKRSNKKRKV
jgi:hypothetical protein